MGGELVGLPPEGEEKPTLSTLFWEAYPAYIQMGMPSEEYWNGDAQACVSYRRAYAENLKIQDMMAWRNGLYVYHALCCAAPCFAFKPQEPAKYISKPFGFEPEKEEKKVNEPPQEAIDYMKAWAESINARRKKKNGNSSN